MDIFDCKEILIDIKVRSKNINNKKYELFLKMCRRSPSQSFVFLFFYMNVFISTEEYFKICKILIKERIQKINYYLEKHGNGPNYRFAKLLSKTNYSTKFINTLLKNQD